MNLRRPMTPAITGPLASRSGSRGRDPSARTGGRAPPACRAPSPPSPRRGPGAARAGPPTTMYASPMVLIFSRPCRSASSSKALKTSSRTPTTRSGRRALGERREVDDVGEQHGDLVVALGDDARSRASSRSAIGRGRTLRRSRSELASAASRARTEYWSSRYAVTETPQMLSTKKASGPAPGWPRVLRDHRLEQPGDDGQAEEGHEPGDGLAGAEEEQRTECARRAPTG